MKQVRYVTLPGIMPIIVLMATLSLGNILNAGFDQILNLYNPTVMKTGDIIDTFVYRIGLQNNQYGIASAMAVQIRRLFRVHLHGIHTGLQICRLSGLLGGF